MSKRKTIGILGGMGPSASAYMYQTLIKLAIRDFGAKNNDDFPEIALFSIPVPDFISDSLQKNKALEMLLDKVKQMNNLSLSYSSIACNTAHILLPQLQRISKVPILSMIDEVVKTVSLDKKTKVGILATPSTINLKLYQTALRKQNIDYIEPSADQLVMLDKIIRNIIAGETGQVYVKALLDIADSFIREGAEGIILGCTELPIIFPQEYEVPIYNSVQILSHTLLSNYYNTN